MTDRKLIRPELDDAKKSPASRGARRRPNPPERTNAEEFYYLKQMAAKTAMVVLLDNGEELRGWIEWYDKDVIKLNRDHAPNLLIPKRSIKYLYKEEEERMHKKRRRPLPGAGPGVDGA